MYFLYLSYFDLAEMLSTCARKLLTLNWNNPIQNSVYWRKERMKEEKERGEKGERHVYFFLH